MGYILDLPKREIRAVIAEIGRAERHIEPYGKHQDEQEPQHIRIQSFLRHHLSYLALGLNTFSYHITYCVSLMPGGADAGRRGEITGTLPGIAYKNI
jgi:hypothetical protein